MQNLFRNKNLRQWSDKAELPRRQYSKRITNYKLQIINYKLQFALQNYKLQITDYKLQITDYKLQIMNYKRLGYALGEESS